MNSMHDEQTLAAAYVLGALDPGERRTFEAHAATCPLCQEEVRSLQRVAAALAHAVPQQTPSLRSARACSRRLPGRAGDCPGAPDTSWFAKLVAPGCGRAADRRAGGIRMEPAAASFNSRGAAERRRAARSGGGGRHAGGAARGR